MENELLEQPVLETETTEEILDKTSSENQEGSNLGKFKSAKSLLEAYNNLQTEFTKKSQKLAELQKIQNKNAIFQNKESYDDFAKSTTDSDEYKKGIEEILARVTDLNNLPNKYQVAYKIIKEAERKSAENLNNPDFIDRNVMDNSLIKDKIISNYLSSLNNIPTAPKVISGNPTSIYLSPKENPKNFKEAGEILKNMFK